MQELGGAGFVVLVRLILPAEVVGVGDEVVDSMLLGIGFASCQRPVVDCDEAAEGAVGCLDDDFFPEVAAGAVGTLLGDVEKVWPMLPGCVFVGSHLLDCAGFLSSCGGGKQHGQGKGDSAQAETEGCPAIH